MLDELQRRRILPAGVSSYSPEDEELLSRLRRAEPAALESLRRERLGEDRRFVYRKPGQAVYGITLEGYERHRQTLRRDAIRLFERGGALARDVFAIKDSAGRPAFDAKGFLTAEGELLSRSLAAGLPAVWTDGAGRAYGSAPAPAAAPAPARPDGWRLLYDLARRKGTIYMDGRSMLNCAGCAEKVLVTGHGMIAVPHLLPGQAFSGDVCVLEFDFQRDPNHDLIWDEALQAEFDAEKIADYSRWRFKDAGCTGEFARMAEVPGQVEVPEDAKRKRRRWLGAERFRRIGERMFAYTKSELLID